MFSGTRIAMRQVSGAQNIAITVFENKLHDFYWSEYYNQSIIIDAIWTTNKQIFQGFSQTSWWSDIVCCHWLLSIHLIRILIDKTRHNFFIDNSTLNYENKARHIVLGLYQIMIQNDWFVGLFPVWFCYFQKNSPDWFACSFLVWLCYFKWPVILEDAKYDQVYTLHYVYVFLLLKPSDNVFIIIVLMDNLMVW